MYDCFLGCTHADSFNAQILNLGSAHEVVSNLQQANKDLIS